MSFLHLTGTLRLRISLNHSCHQMLFRVQHVCLQVQSNVKQFSVVAPTFHYHKLIDYYDENVVEVFHVDMSHFLIVLNHWTVIHHFALSQDLVLEHVLPVVNDLFLSHLLFHNKH